MQNKKIDTGKLLIGGIYVVLDELTLNEKNNLCYKMLFQGLSVIEKIGKPNKVCDVLTESIYEIGIESHPGTLFCPVIKDFNSCVVLQRKRYNIKDINLNKEEISNLFNRYIIENNSAILELTRNKKLYCTNDDDYLKILGILKWYDNNFLIPVENEREILEKNKIKERGL